ncbi:MAG: FapA family protein [Caldimicrobium sp.]|nr:FapA family protein [Caldimicrobium sp.]MDW8183393.1 FapA family protein [Caldimicrobium sp.]
MEKGHIVDRKEAKEIGIFYHDYIFKVNQDDFFLYLESPQITSANKDQFLRDWAEIKEFLQSQGIKFLLNIPEESEGLIILAKGYPPKEGIPERIEFLHKFTRIIEGVSTEDNQIEDLRERFQKIICADKEEAIAKWFPSIPPNPGVNIWGDPIEPPPQKEKKSLELGINVYLDEKENLIRAKKAGVVVYQKEKLDVFPEYTIKGDVDFSIGNIYFVGDKLVIDGDIKFGFKVTCKGNLELKGCTENKVDIHVEGDFNSEGVIRGEETSVKVKGQAQIRGVEFAKLHVEGNLTIKDYLVFTDTVVFGDINAIDGKGIIYGGSIKASGNITAKIIGHISQTKTVISAGYKPEIIEGYLRLIEQELLYKDTLKKVICGIDIAQQMKKEGRFPREKMAIFEKLQQEKLKLEKNLQVIGEKLKPIKDSLKHLRSATVKVINKVYPNVTIGIAELTYTTDSEISGPVTFYLEDNKINQKKA